MPYLLAYERLFIPCLDPSRGHFLPRNERHEQKWSRLNGPRGLRASRVLLSDIFRCRDAARFAALRVAKQRREPIVRKPRPVIFPGARTRISLSENKRRKRYARFPPPRPRPSPPYPAFGDEALRTLRTRAGFVEGAPRENNFLQRRPALQGWEPGGGEGGEGVEWREEDPRHVFRRNRVITRNVRSERAFRRPDRRSIVSRDPLGGAGCWKFGENTVTRWLERV